MTQGGHQPVMREELLEALRIDAAGCYIDATCGGGGHSAAALARLGPRGRLLAFDKDPDACARVAARFAGDPRFALHNESFTAICALRESHGGRCAGIFFDLGVSSPQLDEPARGFSFMRDGPLDMRMDPRQGPSAAEWLRATPRAELARVLRRYGEEPQAERIAGAIAAAVARGRAPQTTRELAALVAAAGARRGARRDPATRVFMAIRLHLNRELEELEEALGCALALLRAGGRLAVIAFHSLEDRIVKSFIRARAAARELRKIGKCLRPGAPEIARNPRARSARLRVAEKCAEAA